MRLAQPRRRPIGWLAGSALISLVVLAGACGSSADELQPEQGAAPTTIAAGSAVTPAGSIVTDTPTADTGAGTEQLTADEPDQGQDTVSATATATSEAIDTDSTEATNADDAAQATPQPEPEQPEPDEQQPEQPESQPTEPAVTATTYFETLPPRSPLPSDQACAQAVRSTPFAETHPENAVANQTAGGPAVRIDGADEEYNAVLAPRITGDFTGTTEELIRWVACKWGFDEDLTRARAWTESSWSILTFGDQIDNQQACDILALASPCYQSYGLLQVKGTVHDNTYPFAHESTAWGLDYAMAWQRACYEGGFSWLVEQGYTAGDVNGCVGAWFSGNWFDDLAVIYLADVAANLNNRPWD